MGEPKHLIVSPALQAQLLKAELLADYDPRDDVDGAGSGLLLALQAPVEDGSYLIPLKDEWLDALMSVLQETSVRLVAEYGYALAAGKPVDKDHKEAMETASHLVDVLDAEESS